MAIKRASDIDMQSVAKVVNLPAPSAGGDGTNKTYVDGAVNGAIVPIVKRSISISTDTPTATDLGKTLTVDYTGSTCTITLLGSGFSGGEWFNVLMNNAAVVTFADGASNTHVPTGTITLRLLGSMATVLYLGSNKWALMGDFTRVVRIITVGGSASAGSVVNTDYVHLLSGGGTCTLPSAALIGTNCYTVKNTDAVLSASVATTSSQTIDGGAAPISLGPLQSLDFFSDGSNWWIS